MSEPDEATDRLAERLRSELNRHGHGFHRALLDEVARLGVTRSGWWREGPSEFPVRVNGQDARIDFILGRVEPFSKAHYWLICEAKRVNPSLGDWCFAGIPNSRHPLSGACYAETIKRGQPTITNLHRLADSDRIYEIGIELKTDRKGEPVGGSGRGAIEDAAGQVIRGMNGFIEFMQSAPDASWQRAETIRLVPVVFTTAQLYATQVALKDADLATGNLPPGGLSLKTTDWLWLHYPQSPGLRHSSHPAEATRSLEDALYHQFVRRVAIVSVAGIENFLSQGIWND